MKWRILSVAFAAAALCACGRDSDTLDVATATSALGAQVASTTPFFRFINNVSVSDDPQAVGAYTALARAGILESYQAPSLLEGRANLHFRLTAKGARLVRGWRKLENGVYEVSVGSFALDGVTSIEMLAPRHAMVKYRYRLEPNAMGRLLQSAGRKDVAYYDRLKARSRDLADAAGTSSEFAEMTKYDGGWRSDSSSF